MFETAMFLELMEKLVKKCHENSKSKGFWDEKAIVNDEEGRVFAPWNFAEKIALMHSELSEALEAHRVGNPPCEKTYPSGFDGTPVKLDMCSVAEEMADVVIRVADLCGKMEIDLGRVILAKMEYNARRPMKHGKAY